MLFSELSEKYLLYLAVERNFTPRSISSYRSWLRHYISWQSSRGYPETNLAHFTSAALNSYLYYLSQERKLRPRSIRAAFAPIFSIGDYLIDTNHLETNPARSVRMPARDAPVQRIATDDEIKALLTGVERVYPMRRRALCRAVLYILTFSGVRRAELLSLKLSDFRSDKEERSLTIRNGKGEKRRTVHIPKICAECVSEWVAQRAQEGGTCEYLFTFDKVRRMGDSSLRTIIKEIRTAAGLENATHLLPHSIRHAYATRLADNGASLLQIMAALGHSHISTTDAYIHANERAQAAASELATFSKETSPEKSVIEQLRAKNIAHRRRIQVRK